MNESWFDDAPLGEWLKRSYPNRIMFAGTMLRLVGWLGAFYCGALIVIISVRWLAVLLDPGSHPVLPVVGAVITGYGFRMILFLLAYAAGVILPVLFHPERPAAGKQEQP